MESRGNASGRAPLKRGTPFLLIEAQEGVQGGTLAGGSPFYLFLGLCVCAVTLGGGRWPALPFDPISFVLPKETVSSRQRKALFYLGGSTIRVSATASVVFTHLRPTLGGGWWLSGRGCVCADTLGGGRWPALPFDPISFVLPKETVSSRQRKAP